MATMVKRPEEVEPFSLRFLWLQKIFSNLMDCLKKDLLFSFISKYFLIQKTTSLLQQVIDLLNIHYSSISSKYIYIQTHKIVFLTIKKIVFNIWGRWYWLLYISLRYSSTFRNPLPTQTCRRNVTMDFAVNLNCACFLI